MYDDGQFSLGPELFVPGMNWGLVQISEDEVLAFNGYHNGVTSNTGIYNFQIDSWTDVGPTPASTYHNRGVLIKGSNGEDIVIITG